MYKISFVPKAVQELLKIDTIWQSRIKQKLEILANDPAALKQNIKSLKGKYSGLARLRIGNYRVIFQVKEKELLILIIRIAHRQDIY